MKAVRRQKGSVNEVTAMVKAGPGAMVAGKTAEATAAAMRVLMPAAAAVVEAAMAAQVTLAVTAVIATVAQGRWRCWYEWPWRWR